MDLSDDLRARLDVVVLVIIVSCCCTDGLTLRVLVCSVITLTSSDSCSSSRMHCSSAKFGLEEEG